jgi:hypothetical protein
MNEHEAFAKDRRRYHAHAITCIVGLVGLSSSPVLANIVDDRVALWLGIAFAATLAASGALAISVGRTIFSKRAEETKGLEHEGDPGDAIESPGLWSFDLWPWFSNAVAPYALLSTGAVFVVVLLFFALR